MNHEPVCGRANIMDVIKKGEIYLTFVFDDMDSTQMKIATVSDGSTYTTTLASSFTDNALELDGYDGRYYFNTRLKQKEFTYNCFIDGLSPYELSEVQAWLNPKKIAKLVRPEEPHVYYWVKVSAISTLANIPLTHADNGGMCYTGNFSITFTTVGQACGNGMAYYKEDLQYYEYRDVFDATKDYAYAAGLLYKEDAPSLNGTAKMGTTPMLIYNPGTYAGKLLLSLTIPQNITEGTMVITNTSAGDVSVINLSETSKGDVFEINYGENTYTLNGETATAKVNGDLLYLNPRTQLERLENGIILPMEYNTWVQFSPSNRIVRSSDVGKTVVFKSTVGDIAGASIGGTIVRIDKETNSLILDESVGVLDNYVTSVVISKFDDISIKLNLPSDEHEVEYAWTVSPRYL